jgi:hypothetical protein
MNPHNHSGHMDHSDMAGNAVAEPKTIHRWVVFGADAVYLSHLSMFSMPEHALQVIVQARFTDPDGTPSPAYAEDRQTHPAQRLYTLDPAEFVLTDVLQPGPASLKADLYRNHVEQEKTNPVRLAADLDVDIVRVIHVHRYLPEPDPLSSLEYVLFGDGANRYLAHFITRPPDFDQILDVTTNTDLTEDELAGGLRVTVPDRANTLETKIEEASGPISVVLHRATGDVTAEITAGIQYYCNSDRDLQ